MRLGLNIASPVKFTVQTDFKYNDLHLCADVWTLKDGTTQPADVATLPGYGAHQYQGMALPGTYTLYCEGTGTIRLNHPDLVAADGTAGHCDYAFPVPAPTPTPTPTPPAAGDAAGYPVVVKAGHKWLSANILANSAADPLRNFRLITPGAAVRPNLIWHPLYLASLGGFPVLRSMDWLHTNASKVSTWADRPVRRGQELEGFFDLCAHAGADPWINLPHLCASASGVTDYPGQLGKLIAATVDPHRTVYLEYSNECWNYAPPFAIQTSYCVKQGELLTDPTTGQPYGNKNQMLAGAAGYGFMMNAAFDAVEQAVGPSGPRIVRIFAGQAFNASSDGPQGWAGYFFHKVLPAWNWRIDALACAPYGGWKDAAEPYTLATLKALLKAGDLPAAVGLLLEGVRHSFAPAAAACAGWRVGADRLGVPLLYYECSPAPYILWHDPDFAPLIDVFLADPRTADLHRDYYVAIAPYAAAGCAFTHCSGPWGLIQYLTDPAGQPYAGARAHAVLWNV